MKILEVKNLRKHFPVERGIFMSGQGWAKAVDGVSFSLDEGETLGIVGESGSGKTTLAKLILRLIEPTSGEIIFSDKLSNPRKDIGIVFQDPLLSLDPRMRIRDILEEPLIVHRLIRGRERIVELLAWVGLKEDILARFPHQLSGGQRQRVCIARSLALAPKLLVLDEPLSSLDLIIQKQVLNLLIDLRQRLGMTYVFISHNLALVRKISGQIIVMLEGRITEDGPATEVFENPKSAYTKKLLEAAA